jgi:hypothetical protein
MASAFLPGSMMYATHATPTSATPSLVGLQPGLVVILDLYAPGTQLGDLRAYVRDTPERLSLRVFGPDGALADLEGGVPALEHDPLFALGEDLEAEEVLVETPSRGEIRGQ